MFCSFRAYYCMIGTNGCINAPEKLEVYKDVAYNDIVNQ